MESVFVTCNHIKGLMMAKKEKKLFTSLKNLIILDKENIDQAVLNEF